MIDVTVRDSWRRIDDYLARFAPLALDHLRPAADPQELARAEASMNVRLPLELRESLAIHDGEEDNSPPLFERWLLLSLAAMTRAHQKLASVHAGDRAWYDPRWVPIAADGAGNHLLITERGELVEYLVGSPERPPVAPGLHDYLQRFAADLESGRLKPALDSRGYFEYFERVK